MPFSTVRVLCLDDSEPEFELVVEAISRGGMKVQSKRIAAREDLQKELSAGPWDVLITELALPGLDAKEAVDMVSQSGRELPMLVVSRQQGEQRAVEAMEFGAKDFLAKVDLTRLPMVVKRTIAAARLRSAHAVVVQELQVNSLRLRNLVRYLAETREHERAALATEVHDAIAGNLIAAQLAIARTDRLIRSEPPMAAPQPADMAREVHEAALMVQNAFEASQKLFTALRVNLKDQGLVAAIEWRLEFLRKRRNIKATLNAIPPEFEIPEMLLDGLHFSVCECIDNIELHARAKNVWCTILLSGGELSIEVRDDGVGCNEVDLAAVDKLGLFSVRERLLLMGGTISIDSVCTGTSTGTTVLINVPVTPAVTAEDANP